MVDCSAVASGFVFETGAAAYRRAVGTAGHPTVPPKKTAWDRLPLNTYGQRGRFK